MVTVSGLIESCARALDEAGVVFGHGTTSAWDEATALVLGVTGLADDLASLDAPIPGEVAERIETLLARRIRERIPLPYLLGRAWFAGLEFLIEPGVVIPRSPIGELIERGFRPWLREDPDTILDLCTGSGCIGIAAALAFPDATATLTDVSDAAVELARRNVARQAVSSRAEVLRGDLYEPLPPTASFDLIVSNPPYVDTGDLSSLPAEYRREPELGLHGGRDGLDVVRRILTGASRFLAPDGLLVCEVGMSAAALLRSYPTLSFVWPDLDRGGEGVFLLSAAALRAAEGSL